MNERTQLTNSDYDHIELRLMQMESDKDRPAKRYEPRHAPVTLGRPPFSWQQAN